MGEAVGIAARFAIDRGCPMREIDGTEVREAIAERGDPLLSKKISEG
jgi:hypothetical protein